MVFSSLLFLFRFLPVMLILYFAAPKRFRNGVLFIGSLVFYGWGEPVYICLLLFSTVVDFVHGKLIFRFLNQGRRTTAKWAVASSAVINLSLLGFFKYTDFIIGSLNGGFGFSIPMTEIALPIGISFYTFQTMSYTIDVYRGKAKVQDSIVAFGAYVSMFPQLIAGPIVRYSTIANELNERTESYAGFERGVRYFLTGLGKKVLIANSIGAVFTQVSAYPIEEQTVLLAWLGIFSFAMQIYFDFSGYSDMAVGLGYMMGFHFPENFNYPYMSKSITDFWRRWHISLSTWFKEYVYIPLGGNKRVPGRQICNILIVWLLTGIWHGAGWNFLLWGLYFGILLLLEKFVLKTWLERLPGILQNGYTMLLVTFGWVLFAHDDLGQGLAYLGRLFGAGGTPFCGGETLYLIFTNLPLIAAAIIGSTSLPKRVYQGVMASGSILVRRGSCAVLAAGMAAVLFLSTAYLVDASYNPFLYFRF